MDLSSELKNLFQVYVERRTLSRLPQRHRLRCTLFRKVLLRWSRSSLCGQNMRLWRSWCAWWGSVGGSEPERPSGVSSLTTGRTPEPLNPGLHFVRSIAPWDSSRGALTALVFWLDPRHSQSWDVHDNSTTSLSPASIITINTVQRGCLCVPASSGVYGCLTHSRWAHSRRLAANKHSLLHTRRHVYSTKITCSSKHRHMYISYLYVQKDTWRFTTNDSANTDMIKRQWAELDELL